MLRVGSDRDHALRSQSVAGSRRSTRAARARRGRGRLAGQRDVGASGEASGGARARARARATNDNSTVKVDTGEEAEQGQTDVGVNVDASGTAKNSGELSTSVNRKREQTLTAGNDRQNTTQDSREELVDSLQDKRQETTDESTAEVDAHINLNTDGKPEQGNRLELDTKAAVFLRDPLGESVTSLRAKRLGGLAVRHSAEGGLDIVFKASSKVTLEEGTNASLGAATQETVRVNTGTNISTNGDGDKTTGGDVAERDNTVTGLALQPSLEGARQVTAQAGVATTVEESLESALDITRQAGDETTTTSEVETSLGLGREGGFAGFLKEGVQGLLERRAKNNLSTNVGGTEDTVEGNDETTLSGKVSGRRAQNRQTSRNIDAQEAVVTTCSPVEQRRTQANIDVDTVATAQPGGKLLTSRGVDGTSLNT